MNKIIIILFLLILSGCNNTLNEMDEKLEYYQEQINEDNQYIEAKKEGIDELEQKVIEAYVEKADDEYEKRIIDEYKKSR